MSEVYCIGCEVKEQETKTILDLVEKVSQLQVQNENLQNSIIKMNKKMLDIKVILSVARENGALIHPHQIYEVINDDI